MVKNIILLLLFVLLGGAVIWVTSNKKEVEDTFAEKTHTKFALQNTDQIERIFLVDRRGNQALLEKQSDLEWTYTNKVTGKKYRANPSVIWTLLETIRKIRVRYPVGKSAEANAVKGIAAQGVKIEIYDGDNNKLRVYNVGPMTDGAMGNFVNMDGSDKVYVGYIPKSPGTIDTRYVTTEVDWRDKAIFRNKTEALEFVEVEYHAPPQHPYSFRISRTGKETFNVTPLDERSPKYEQVNQSNALTYIEDFDVVAAERIIEDKPLRDSTVTKTPFATVRYKATYHNQPQSFRIYSIYNPDADRGDGRVGHRQKLQRYLVDIDKDNFFLAQHLVMRKILWSYEYFFQTGTVKLEEDEAAYKRSFPEEKYKEKQGQ